MIAKVKAKYLNGAMMPLEPLDLEEGREVVVTIEDGVGAATPKPAFRVVPNNSGFAPGVDSAKIKQFLYEGDPSR